MGAQVVGPWWDPRERDWVLMLRRDGVLHAQCRGRFLGRFKLFLQVDPLPLRRGSELELAFLGDSGSASIARAGARVVSRTPQGVEVELLRAVDTAALRECARDGQERRETQPQWMEEAS